MNIIPRSQKSYENRPKTPEAVSYTKGDLRQVGRYLSVADGAIMNTYNAVRDLPVPANRAPAAKLAGEVVSQSSAPTSETVESAPQTDSRPLSMEDLARQRAYAAYGNQEN